MGLTPWDDLPNAVWNKRLTDAVNRKRNAEAKLTLINEASSEIIVKERNYFTELENIGRRAAFGLVCGGITGATFGFFDILRDPKSMTLKADATTKKVLRFSAYFGGFFAVYQSTRKALKYNVSQSAEENALTSAAITIIPMLFSSSLRPLIPYGVFLIGIDALQGLNDI